MSKIRTFIYVFKRSLSDITYYNDVLKAPLSFSVKYLYLLTLITIFIVGLFVAFALATFYPKAPAVIQTIKQRVKTAYPPELVVQVKKGEVTTNVKEPYFIDIPEFKDVQADKNTRYNHLITIDTQATIDDYRKYNTVVLVTKKAVVYPERERNGRSSYRVSYLDDVENDFVINQAKYNEFTARYLPYFDYLPKILLVLGVLSVFILPFIISVFVLLWQLLYVAILSFVNWIISQIFKNNLSYKEVYQIGLHAVTLPIVVTFLLRLFSITIPNLFTLGFILWVVIILTKVKGQKPTTT